MLAAVLLLSASIVSAQHSTTAESTLTRELPALFALAHQHSPRLRAAGYNVDLATGSLSEARGQFDPLYRATTTLEVARGELLPASVRQQFQSRFLLEQLDESFTRTADNLQAQLDATEGPVVFECDGTIIVINGREVCDTPEAAAEREALLALLEALTTAAPTDEQLIALQQVRDQAVENNREVLAETIAQLRRVAESSRRSRARLGTIPKSERKTTATFDFSLVFPQRNGWIVTPQLILEGVDDTFESKPRNASDGGKGLERVFRSALGTTLTVPLGRGGRELAASSEDAAVLQLDAARDQARSTRQLLHRDVLQGYVALAAAHARAELAAVRVQRNTGFLQTANALIEADEIAPQQRSQAQALLAQANGVQLLTERLRIGARRDLAAALGVALDAVPHAPGLSELEVLATLPVCAGTDLEWQRRALAARPDLEAARWRLRAAERLDIAAQDLLLPRIDLGVTLAYGGREETDHLLPGFGNALFDSLAGPSILVSLNWDLAIRNDAARGQRQQALALVEQAEQTLADGERAVAGALAALRRQLDDGARLLALRRDALAGYRDAHAAQDELVRLGERDLVSIVDSEAQLDRAEGALVDAAETQARRLIQLRFLLGALDIARGQQGDLAWLRVGSCGGDE